MTSGFATPVEAVSGRFLRIAALAGAFALVGALAAVQPLAGLGLIGVGVLVWRGERLDRDVFTLLLLGNVVLTYSFANVGLRLGPMPIPVTEMLLLPLLGWCLWKSEYLKDLGLPGVLLVVMLGFATIRLLFDFPVHGNLAVRDYTTPLEYVALIAGFWMFNRYGLAWSTRTWTAVFVVAILYSLTYPWGETLAQIGPTVGLQKPIPLLGQYNGSGPAMAAAFFFCLLTMKRPWSFIMGAFCLGAIALFQLRGLYLALPMGAFLILISSGRLNTRLVPRMIGAVAVASCIFVMVLPLGLQGRMGPLTFSFATEQLGTLVGKKGAGDGSRDDRVTWARNSWNDLTATTDSLLFGVGLGPDLTHGAMLNGTEAIRKPHNDFLEVLARFGFVGFGIWLAFMVSVFVPVWRATRFGLLTAAERTFMLWILAGVLVYLFTASNQPVLAFPYGTIPVFTMLGMALALARQAAGRKSVAEESS